MANDLYHDAVVTALEKEGWTILKENYHLMVDEGFNFMIDILAERYVVAQRAEEWIVVEVKSFNRASSTYEFHSAIGQYITYRTALKYIDLDIKLYLAAPNNVFHDFFQFPFIQFLLKEYDIEIMPFDPNKKIITT